MDRTVLLLVLCLQVFLLISAFASADAAALGVDPQQGATLVKRGLSHCWRMPGGCALFGKEAPGVSLNPTKRPPEINLKEMLAGLPELSFKDLDEFLIRTPEIPEPEREDWY